MAVTPDGKGYLLITATGSEYSYGDAPTASKVSPAHPLIGLVGNPTGGYYAYSAYGNIYNIFGATSYGSPASTGVSDISGMTVAPGYAGYWVTDKSGNVYNYGDATPLAPLYSTNSFVGIMASGSVPSNTTKFTYDGTGLRSSETTPDNFDYTFAYDLSSSQPEILSDSRTSYIYGPNGQPIEQISNGGPAVYLSGDQLGSTRLITAANGTELGTYTYGAYGNPTYHNATPTGGPGHPAITTNLGFAGQYTDPYTGLQYDTARYYDPQTAQFISQDPLVDITGQAYSYAADNPINNTDPSGLDSITWGLEGSARNAAACQSDPSSPACAGTGALNAIGSFVGSNYGTFLELAGVGTCFVPGVGAPTCALATIAGLTANQYQNWTTPSRCRSVGAKAGLALIDLIGAVPGGQAVGLEIQGLTTEGAGQVALKVLGGTVGGTFTGIGAVAGAREAQGSSPCGCSG
jgi:RHS repeat-associated protein